MTAKTAAAKAAAHRAPPVPIVALDFPDAQTALRMVDQIGDACKFYKVGSELFTAAGPQIVQTLRALGHEVFLDLKFHDIPNTVRGAARSAAAMGARLITVHASGGRAMIEAAVEGAGDQSKCGVLGVTILTSVDAASLRDGSRPGGGRTPVELAGEALRLAGDCAAAGAKGVVSSAVDGKKIRAKYADRLTLLIPGIRAAGAKTHDQKRAATPTEAARAGADFIVLGRMVTESANPRAELRAAMASI